MASQYPVDPKLLVLEEALYDVWAVLAAHEPHRDRTQDQAKGVTNIAELSAPSPAQSIR
jgi:hypothetical protein